MTVAAVIVNFNSGRDLESCLRSLRSQTRRLTETIVVDNGSGDDSLREVPVEYADVQLIRNPSNVGFAMAANRGAAAATSDVLLFLNPDVKLDPDCVEQLVRALADKPGVAGPALSLHADSSDLHGGTIDRLGYPAGVFAGTEPLYVPGSALATVRWVFVALGGFDERYFMFAEDVDYCWRVLLAGLEVSVCASARAIHRGGAIAVGGYVRGGSLETTSFRFTLRERNSFAMLAKCAPGPWLAWLIPSYVVKTGILALGAVAMGQAAVGRGLISGLLWNLMNGRETYRLRKMVVRSEAGRATAIGRIHRGSLAIAHVRRFGLPRFVEQGRSSPVRDIP